MRVFGPFSALCALIFAGVGVDAATCPSGTSAKTERLKFNSGHCNLCGERGYGCGNTHSYPYNDHTFIDSIPTGNELVVIYWEAKGALGCSEATAALQINGVQVGTHDSAGTCMCGTCFSGGLRELWSPTMYNYGGPNTLSYRIIQGTNMCTAHVMVTLCYRQNQCGKGQYRDGSCKNCPAGKYQDTPGGIGIGSCVTCPAGKFGSSPGATTSECSGSCALGHYCTAGSTSSTQNVCQAGSYGGTPGQTSASCSGRCDPGYFCPAGSTSKRPAGKECAAGRYGNGGDSTSQCAGQCSAGYYCPPASSSPTQNPCGGSHVYCPAGVGTPVSVNSGHYSLGGTSATTRTQQEVCPKGTYCTGGAKLDCPVGTYGSAIGLSSNKCTGKCEAGYFCPAGSTSSTQQPCGTGTKPAGFYCPEGTTSRVAVSAGSYSVPESSPPTNRKGQEACGGDYSCTDGVRKRKVSITNCAGGARSVSALEGVTNTNVGDVLTATTASGNAVQWAVLSVSPGSTTLFTIGTSNGQVKIGSTPLNHQLHPEHTVVVRAEDTAAGAASTCTLVVKVDNRNDAPYIPAGQRRSVEEKSAVNTAVGNPVDASDQDAGQSLQFEITSGNTGDAFAITACSGQLSVKTAVIDFRAKSTYDLVIKVCDDGKPPSCSSETVIVNVIDTADAPIIQASPRSFSVSEATQSTAVATLNATDADGGTLTWTLRFGSPTFRLDPRGALSILDLSRINFEVQNQYMLTVRVTDPSGEYSEADITVSITDANDPPVVTRTTLFLPENNAANTLLAGAVSVTDEDAGATVTLSITGAQSSKFSITNDGKLTATAANVLNFEANPNFVDVTVQASDGTATSTNTIRVQATDVNEQPNAPGTTYSFSLAENLPAGTLVAASVPTTDPDIGQTLFYSITGGDPTKAFTIGSLSSEIRTTRPLDFEETSSYTLQVEARDTGGLSRTYDVTVTVTNVNEPPIINPTQSLTVPENSAAGTSVGTVQVTDPDSSSFTFAITRGNQGGAFTIQSSTGALTVNSEAAINFESSPTFTLTISVEDNLGLSSTGTVDVLLTNVNEAPVWQIPQLGATTLSRFVSERSPVGTNVGSPVVALDPDAGDTVQFSTTPGGRFSVDSATGQIRVAQAMTQGNPSAGSTLTVSVTASDGTLSASINVIVDVTNQADPPTLDSQSRSVPENSPKGTLVGDPVVGRGDDGVTLNWSIDGGNEGGVFQIGTSTGQISVARTGALDFETKNSYPLRVVATDTKNLQSSTTVTVAITNVNEKPSLAAAARTVPENSPAGTQVGSVLTATDPDAGTTFSFSIASGNAQGLWAISPGGQITVAKAGVLDFEVQSVYTFRASVSDGSLSAEADVTVTLSDANDAPKFTQTFAFSVLESAVQSTSVGTVTGVDEDRGDELTYSLTGGDGQATFGIDSKSGRLFVNGALDFETKDSYSVVVEAKDKAGAVATTTVVVAVSNVNEPPVVASSFSATVSEAAVTGTVFATLTARDPDGDAVAWTILAGNVGNVFSIEAATGKLSVSNTLDFETRASYTLTVQVQDANGLGRTSTVSITLLDANEPPTMLAQTRSVRENTPANTRVGAALAASDDSTLLGDMTFKIIAGNVGSLFSVSEGHLVVAIANLDHERTAKYVLTVQVEDEGGLTATAPVTVLIEDVNEAPVVTPATVTVKENSAVDTSVGDPIIASDPDAGQTLTYTISRGDGNGIFSINRCSGQISVARAVLDYETNSTYVLEVTATDDGTNPAPLSGSATVTVQLEDVNEAPIVPASQQRSINENSAVGSQLGSPLTGRDEDANQALTWRIESGNEGAAFSVNPSTGQLSVATSASLDFETRPLFDLLMSVTDNGSPPLSATTRVKVQLINVDEAPVFDLNSLAQAVDENSPSGTPVGTLTARDPDGSAVTYSVTGGTGQALFELTDANVGLLSVKAGAVLNFEATRSYSLVVSASDGTLTTEATVTVEIRDVNEPPTCVSASFTIPENSPVGTSVNAPMTVSDPDTLANQVLTLSVVGQSPFRVSGQTLETRVSSLDYETQSVYTVTVRVTDSGQGRLSADCSMVVRVADENEAPVLTGRTFSINENLGGGALVGIVSATDEDGDTLSLTIDASTNSGGAFSIESSTGRLTTNLPLNFEAVSTYLLTVRASDGALSTPAQIRVDVQNVNDPPVMLDQTRRVDEDKPIGTIVGSQISARDEDAGQTLSFLIYQPTNTTTGLPRTEFETKRFSITPDGQLKVAQNPIPQGTYLVAVSVSDGSSGSATCVVTVIVEEVNDPPIVSASSATVDENSPVNTQVGQVTATNEETGQTISWSISGGDLDNEFAVNSQGLVFVAKPTLDFEKRPSYSLVVRATDDGSPPAAGSATLTVQLRNVNEAPVAVSQQARQVDEMAPLGTLVGAPLMGTDPDAGDTLAFRITGGNEAGMFAVDAATGQLRVAVGGALDYETKSRYDLTVRITDRDGLWSEGSVTVSLNDLNDVPTAEAVREVVNENAAAGTIVKTISARDRDANQVLTYLVSGGACWGYPISAATKIYHTLPTASAVVGNMSAVLHVQSTGRVFVALVPSLTQDMRAKAPGIEVTIGTGSAGKSVSVRECVNCDSTSTTGDEAAAPLLSGSEIRAFWISMSSSEKSLTVGSGTSVGSNVLLRYTLASTSLDSVQALAVAAESPTPGNFHSVCLNNPRASPGSAVLDVDPKSGTVKVADGALLDFETQSKYGIQVTVTDDGTPALSTVTTVEIVLRDVNERPAFVRRPCSGSQGSSDGATIVQCMSVPENSAVGTVVSGLALAATDQDAGSTRSFTLVSGNVGNAFALDSSTGVLRVARAVLNHEDTLTGGRYELGVRVTDNGGLWVEGMVPIDVQDVNEAPTVVAQSRSVPENSPSGTAVGAEVVATDPDSGAMGVVKFKVVGGDGFGLFAFNSNGTVLMVAPGAALNHEAKSVYTLNILAVDAGGLTDSAVLTVNVLDVNEKPALQDVSVAIDENSPVNANVGSALRGVDPDNGQTLLYTILQQDGNVPAFKIGACSGQISVARNVLDFETKRTYTLKVQVKDDGVPVLSDTATVTITVNDVNEAPVASAATFKVDENSPVSTRVGTVQATDVDAGSVLTYSLLPSADSAIFTVVPSTGEVRVAQNVLNYEVRTRYEVTVRVTDNGAPALYADAPITILVNDVNEAPVVPAGQRRSVPENSPAGTVLGDPIIATDEDVQQSMLFSLVSSAGNRFSINELTGALSVAVGAPSLDFEATPNSFVVGISVRDNGVPVATTVQNVTVVLTNVNEMPVCSGAAQLRSIAENSAIGTSIGAALSATDVDADTELTWSISANNLGNVFTVDAATGQLSVARGTLNFEATPSYDLRVSVRDNGSPSLSVQCVVPVTIVDVNEAPVLEPNALLELDENALPGTQVDHGTILATDPDNAKTQLQNLTFSVTGGTGAAAFSIGPSSGQLRVKAGRPAALLDYETQTSLTVTVEVVDDGSPSLRTSATYVVSLRNVNERPVLDNAVFRVDEDSAVGVVVGDMVARDPDANQKLTYSILQSGIPGAVDISADTGRIVIRNAVPFSTPRVFSIVVEASDGSLNATATATLNVTDTNDRPVANAQALNLAENSAAGTVVGQAVASDAEGDPLKFQIYSARPARGADLFSLSVSGQLTVASVVRQSDDLNFEALRQYELLVGVTDGALPTDFASYPTTFVLTVQITDVPEPPVLTAPSRMAVPENSAGGTVVGRVFGSDPDASDAGGLRYSMVKTAGAVDGFVIDPTTGQVSVRSNAVLDYEAGARYTYSATVTDRTQRTATATVQIDLTNVNEAPTLTASTFSVFENASAGSVVGIVPSSDSDAATTLSYSITSGNVDGLFGVNGAGNTLRLTVQREALDWENVVSYSLVVKATDDGIPENRASALSSTTTVTVNVLDVNDLAITGFSGSVLHSTRGGETIVLEGTNFGDTTNKAQGAALPPVRVTYESAFNAQVRGKEVYEAKNCRVSVRNTRIECSTVAGVGRDLRWTASVANGRGTSSVSTVTAYLPPNVTSVLGASGLSTAGGQVVTLRGTNFGPNGTNLELSYGPVSGSLAYKAACTMSVAHAELACVTRPGVGSPLFWQLRVGQQSSPVFSAGGYGVPVISAVVPGVSRLNTVGGDRLTVKGANFGPGVVDDSTAGVTVSYGSAADSYKRFTALKCTVPATGKHSEIECLTARGVGADWKVVVSVGGQQSSASATGVSYAVPVLTRVSGPGSLEARTSGNETVELRGSQLGHPEDVKLLSARYGKQAAEYVAEGCIITVPHTTVTCRTVPGTGTNHSWVLAVGGQDSGMIFTGQGYAAPVVVDYTGAGAADARTSGGQRVRIMGRQFGTVTANKVQGVTYRRPDGPLFSATGCRVAENHTVVECDTVPGAGTGLAWTVVIDGQVSSAPTTGYAPPVVTSVVGPGAAGASTEGGQGVTLLGSDFGPASPSYLESVTYGPTGREYTPQNCAVVNHTAIQCTTVPGVGQALRWSVRVERQSSPLSQPLSSYALPVVTGAGPLHGPTSGGTVVVLNATGLGLLDPSARQRVVFGSQKAVPVPSVKHSDGTFGVLFTVPAGVGENVSMVVEVVGADGTVYRAGAVLFSYHAPRLDKVVVRELGTLMPGTSAGDPQPPQPTSGFLLDVYGFNLGAAAVRVFAAPALDSTGTSLSGQQELDVVGSATHQLVTVAFAGTNGFVQAEVAGRKTPPVRFENLSPLITAFAASDPNGGTKAGQTFTTRGNDTLTLRGQHFIGSTISVLVSVPLDNAGTIEKRHCVVTEVIAGKPADDSTATEEEKLDELRCRMPEGQGRGVAVEVLRGTAASGAFSVSYTAPTVSAVAGVPVGGGSRRRLLAGGEAVVVDTEGQSLTLTGSDFGLSPRVVLRGVDPFTGNAVVFACAPGAGTHGSLTCSVPPGQGAGLDLVLFVGNQEAVVPRAVRYEAPTLAAVSPAGGPTTGENVTLTGRYFGTAEPRVYLGGRRLAVTAFGQRSLSVRVPAGQGAGFPFRVDAWSQVANGLSFAYSPPVITGAPSPPTAATSGGVNVTLTGANFGTAPSVRLECTGDCTAAAPDRPTPNVTVRAALVTVSPGHDALQFPLPSGGGARWRVFVDAGGQLSSAPASFSYLPPNVTTMTPGNCTTDGDCVVTLAGASFGPREWQRVSMAGSPSWGGVPKALDPLPPPVGDAELQDAHSRVRFRVPVGVGRNLTVVLSVGGLSSRVLPFRYNPPEITSIRPNEPDAEGEELDIRGRNFGPSGQPATVLLDDVECAEATTTVTTSYGGETFIRCRAQRAPAGAKNITVTVAFQTAFWAASEGHVETECKRTFYGRPGELCLTCPLGGECLGKGDDPMSIDGWWSLQLATPTDRCPPERQARDTCPLIVPCEPKLACTGNNTCAAGYTAVRCSECVRGTHYRLDGFCVECPDNPWVLIVGFIVAAIGICAAGYVLNRKKLHLAFLSIGVDYAQVLAMFARSRVRWPSELVALFRILSAFNFNLEIAAPECAIPDVDFEAKWWFTMALPLGAASIFLVLHAAKYLQKRCIKGRRQKLCSHTPALVATFFTMFYYMYLMMTRAVLDVFNCSPTAPPDGNQYMEAVFVPCYQPGGLHLRLLGPAVVALVLYVITYPAVVAYVLYSRRALIREDQFLRAKGLGEGRLTNPRAYETRKMFHKTYYHFRPDFHFWSLFVIGRKFAIAVTALMFRKNPSFQLSMALLVLFISYALQVRYRPFMSTADGPTVVRDMERRAEEDPTGWEARMVVNVNTIKTDKLKMRQRWRASVRTRPVQAQAKDFIWNYNTVEATLLFCAVLVCLSGVMFESNRFESDYFDVQRRVITYCVMIVIAFSFVYFMAVFLTEMLSTFSPNTLRWIRSRTQKDRVASSDDEGESAQETERGKDAIDPRTASLGVNPMFMSATTAEDIARITDTERSAWNTEKYRVEYDRVRGTLDDIKAQNEKLVDEVRALKKASSMQAGTPAGNVAFARARTAFLQNARRPAKKREFAPNMTRSPANSGSSTRLIPEGTPTSPNPLVAHRPLAPGSPVVTGAGAGAAKQESGVATAVSTGESILDKDGVTWSVLKDPKGRAYYMNTVTRATSWDVPETA